MLNGKIITKMFEKLPSKETRNKNDVKRCKQRERKKERERRKTRKYRYKQM